MGQRPHALLTAATTICLTSLSATYIADSNPVFLVHGYTLGSSHLNHPCWCCSADSPQRIQRLLWPLTNPPPLLREQCRLVFHGYQPLINSVTRGRVGRGEQGTRVGIVRIAFGGRDDLHSRDVHALTEVAANSKCAGHKTNQLGSVARATNMSRWLAHIYGIAQPLANSFHVSARPPPGRVAGQGAQVQSQLLCRSRVPAHGRKSAVQLAVQRDWMVCCQETCLHQVLDGSEHSSRSTSTEPRAVPRTRTCSSRAPASTV